eukprot:scaffold2403_cov141-Isochrysis_galbana.AAC.6
MKNSTCVSSKVQYRDVLFSLGRCRPDEPAAMPESASESELLVLILSTPTAEGVARRATLRDTWARSGAGCGVLFRFMLGLPRFRNDTMVELTNAMAPPAADLYTAVEVASLQSSPDELVLPCQETYQGLSRKVWCASALAGDGPLRKPAPRLIPGRPQRRGRDVPPHTLADGPWLWRGAGVALASLGCGDSRGRLLLSPQDGRRRVRVHQCGPRMASPVASPAGAQPARAGGPGSAEMAPSHSVQRLRCRGCPLGGPVRWGRARAALHWARVGSVVRLATRRAVSRCAVHARLAVPAADDGGGGLPLVPQPGHTGSPCGGTHGSSSICRGCHDWLTAALARRAGWVRR